MMKSHRAAHRSWLCPGLAVACSAVTVVAVGVTALSAGPVRLTAAAILLAVFVGASWLLQRARFDALGPAVGLALACLILIGLALAAVGALNSVAIASALGAVTLAAAWASTTLHPSAAHPSTAAHPAEWKPPQQRPSSFVVGGAVIFAAAAACSVYYSAASATADSERASSPALWAYPVGDQLDVGLQQPAGYGSTSLRIVVTQAGITIAAWKDIRVAPGQTWKARPIALTGSGPAQVVAFRGGIVVARLPG
jgi:hypothetical protein